MEKRQNFYTVFSITLLLISAFGTSATASDALLRSTPLSVDKSPNNFSINYSLRPSGVIDPFVGTQVDVDVFKEQPSYTQSDHSYEEEVKEQYNWQAGVQFSKTKSFALNFDPKTQKISTEIGLFNLKKNARLKLRVNTKRVKAELRYKW